MGEGVRGRGREGGREGGGRERERGRMVVGVWLILVCLSPPWQMTDSSKCNNNGDLACGVCVCFEGLYVSFTNARLILILHVSIPVATLLHLCFTAGCTLF